MHEYMQIGRFFVQVRNKAPCVPSLFVQRKTIAVWIIFDVVHKNLKRFTLRARNINRRIELTEKKEHGNPERGCQKQVERKKSVFYIR